MASSEPHSVWSGFYKKALKERQTQLALAFPALFRPKPAAPQEHAQAARTSTTDKKQSAADAQPDDSFPLVPIRNEVADNMIENCIGTIGLPIGLALNFIINGRPLVVPMVTEEPSVVAAVSGAAKTISGASIQQGFEASATDRSIIFAQIQLLDIPDERIQSAERRIRAEEEAVLRLANECCSSMHRRGGGALALEIRTVRRSRPVVVRGSLTASYWLVVHIHLDVCDAMGANCASTVAEGVAPLLAELTGARIGFRIVSNLATERIASAIFRVPTSKLEYKGFSGDEVANRIVEAYEWAYDDPFRAVTHNKGIMNGIDAVAIASGQDWRAIEASSHAWAALAPSIQNQDGNSLPKASESGFNNHPYKPLTRYWIEEPSAGERMLCGELKIPICVGTRGGVIKSNPVYRYTLGMMGNPDARHLAMIMASVGLAQNFAALRALSTEGIQRGHMSLHARNIAIAAGAPAHAIQECVAYMIESSRITLVAAKEYLSAHHLLSQISMLRNAADKSPTSEEPGTPLNLSRRKSMPLSMFYFEEQNLSEASVMPSKNNEDQLALNIAFASFSERPVNIELTASSVSSNEPLVQALFGSKTFEWINAVPGLLDRIRLHPIAADGTISTHASIGSNLDLAGVSHRANKMLSKKLKLLSILINILARRLLAMHPNEMTEFLSTILPLAKSPRGSSANLNTLALSDGMHDPRLPIGLFQTYAYDAIKRVRAQSSDQTILVGIPLFLAIWQVFHFRVLQWVGDESLAADLLDEQHKIIESLRASVSIPPSLIDVSARKLQGNVGDDQARVHVDRLFKLHARRFQTTLFLLCDAISLDKVLESAINASEQIRNDTETETDDILDELSSMLTASSKNRLRRRALYTLGRHLEREQALAHDLSPKRLLRDMETVGRYGLSLTGDICGTKNTVNVFVAWLHLECGWTIQDIVDKSALVVKEGFNGDAWAEIKQLMIKYISNHRSNKVDGLRDLAAAHSAQLMKYYGVTFQN